MMKKVEFLIVGNGLAGTLLAFELWQHKIDFRIISAEQKKSASAVAAGMFNPLVFKRLTKSWLVDDLLPFIKGKYTELENLLGTKFYFEKDILKPLSAQENLLWHERKTDSGFSKYITSVEDKITAKHLNPAAGFGRVTGSGYVNLGVFLEQSQLFFMKKNLAVNGMIDYGKINPGKTNFETSGVLASKIVFCEGVHVTQNPFFQFVKIVPTKGEILLIHAADLSEEFILNKKVFVLPVGNRRFKVGSTYDWKDLSWQPTENGKSSITDRLEKLTDADYTIENHLSGVRPAASDRRPVLGFHPDYRYLSVFNGLGTKGVMLAPYFAHEMFKLLTIKDYSTNSEVGINRFL